MNAGMQTRDGRDGWFGVSSLVDPQIFQIDGKPNGMEIKFFYSDGIPLKPGVHISLNPSTQGFIKEISQDKDTY